MPTISEKVQERLAVREIMDYAESLPHPDAAHFWECLRDACLQKAPFPVQEIETSIRPYKEAEAFAYGREPLTFGQYGRDTYEHVYNEDPDYLFWLADKAMGLLRWLAFRKTRK